MRSVTDAKGLSDLRTAIASRVHSKPPQKGTTHLDLYLLDMEKRRLEKELALLERRRQRIQGHVAEIAEAMAKLGQMAAPVATTPRTRPKRSPETRRRWGRLSVYY